MAFELNVGSNDLTVNLMADSERAPGAVVESFHVTGAMRVFGHEHPPVVLDSVLHPLLSPGALYWIIGSVPKDTWAVWAFNSTGDRGFTAGRMNSGPWRVHDNSDRSAFRVTGREIPEPSTIVVLSQLGALAISVAWWRRRRAA